jgi:hypothetical protein
LKVAFFMAKFMRVTDNGGFFGGGVRFDSASLVV